VKLWGLEIIHDLKRLTLIHYATEGVPMVVESQGKILNLGLLKDLQRFGGQHDGMVDKE